MADSLAPGSWPSPLSATALAQGSARISGARFVGDEIWWGDAVPSEGGRVAVFAENAGSTRTVLPAPWNARSRVHEYGGGAWTTRGTALVFVEASDQRIHILREGEEPVAITPPAPSLRYGDLVASEHALIAVREDVGDGSDPVMRAIVAVDEEGGEEPRVLVTGADFVAFPRLSPDGSMLAWMEWDHPSMPWDSARICLMELSNPASRRVIAGGEGVAALQPEWESNDSLIFSSDEATPETLGFSDPRRWNLRRATISNGTVDAIRPVFPRDADTGGPLWILGSRWFSPLGDGKIAAVATHGSDDLTVIGDGGSDTVPTPLSGEVQIADVSGDRILLTGAGRSTTRALLLTDLATGDSRIIAGGALPVDERYLSPAEAIVFEGAHGPVHAFNYPPHHPENNLAPGERAPYLLLAHGGPTTHTSGAASAEIAYFTSRGIGVLDVNYGGSTGYGRSYRERLLGAWGVADAEDMAAAARGIVESGVADPERLAIKGGSAGGWTVLCSLAASEAFSAGISRYGVADLRGLASDTHDFESRYLDGLVGPYPEAEDLYISRSPLSHPESLTAPMLILQGADDPVVPPSQSEAIVEALRASGVPHRYVLYPGESHGFRQTSTIVDAFESELSFLGETFGFSPSL